MSTRTALVNWLEWGIAHEGALFYTETAERAEWLNKPPGILPFYSDCSGWSIAVLKWAGADVRRLVPNGILGYTGTFLDVCELIQGPACQPGDFVVYGPGTGVHMAPIAKAGPDPTIVSHGSNGLWVGPASQGCPESGYVAGRPYVRFLRFLPPDPPPVKRPLAKRVLASLKTIVKSPVTVAARRKLNTEAPIIVVPPGEGRGLAYVSRNIWQGIPNQTELERLKSLGVKEGTPPRGWWRTAKQVQW